MPKVLTAARVRVPPTHEAGYLAPLRGVRTGWEPQPRRRPGRVLGAAARTAVPRVAAGVDGPGGRLRRALTCTVTRRPRTGSTLPPRSCSAPGRPASRPSH